MTTFPSRQEELCSQNTSGLAAACDGPLLQCRPCYSMQIKRLITCVWSIFGAISGRIYLGP